MNIVFIIFGISFLVFILFINKSFKNRTEEILSNNKQTEITRFNSVDLTFYGNLSVKRGRGDIIVFRDYIFLKTYTGGLDMFIYNNYEPDSTLFPLKFKLTDVEKKDNKIIIKGRLKRLLSNNATTIRISGLSDDKLGELNNLINEKKRY